MTDFHHCPSCELVFRNKTELEYHWAEEHDPRFQPQPPGPEQEGGEGPGDAP